MILIKLVKLPTCNAFKGVEWLGNLLPHPVVLFIWMSVILLGLSAILSAMDVAVIDPRPEGCQRSC